MSLRYIITLIFISAALTGYPQLVTKKDYTAAFALQAGAESSILTTSGISQIKITPAAGLKMTFPFNRKWFIGSEINYSQSKIVNKYSNSGTEYRLKLDLEQITIPVYAKYMLTSNRDMLLFGGYVSRLLSDRYDYSITYGSLRPETFSTPLENGINKWDYGFTLGYEHLFNRNLALAFKINCGIHSFTDEIGDKKFIPLKASLTLSYNLFRLGDCGCH